MDIKIVKKKDKEPEKETESKESTKSNKVKEKGNSAPKGTSDHNLLANIALLNALSVWV